MNIIHAFEQVQATLRDLAPVLHSYKKNLIKQGFTEEEAFTLVRDFHREVLDNDEKK